MIQSAILACLLALVLSLVFGKFMIPVLHRMKFGQQVREEGPQSHLKKQGTPTMGGIIFLAAILVAVLPFLGVSTEFVPALLVMLGFGAIGFTDDYIKIVKKRSEGLTPKQKMALQFLVCLLFCVYMMAAAPERALVKIPFTEIEWNLGWLYAPFLFVVVLGTDNGTNFTDGLDGLCSSVTIVVALFFGLYALVEGDGTSILSGAVIGALMGFLCYNVHPAKVFMGDTGSLALGGYVAATALMLKLPLFILFVGFIYLAEVVSVILQVGYFKMTGGKRIFRMAPIHHHFELGGWSETRVVAVFSVVTAVCGMIAWLAK